MRERLAGWEPERRRDAVLACFARALGDDALEELLVLGRVSDAHVEDDLHQPRTLVRVREAELLLELRPHVRVVVTLQPRFDLVHLPYS